MEKVGRSVFMKCLFRGQRSDSCINSLSWVRMERSYIKQILMQMKLNSVRVQPPGSQISQTINGKDATWIKNREKFDERVEPMAIYEVHPGSWKKHPQSEENEKGFYNYREFAHTWQLM